MGNSFRNHFNKESSSRLPTRSNSRSNGSSSPTPSSLRTSTSSLHGLNFFHSRSSSPATREPVKRLLPEHKGSDAECWEKMLELQMEYHCYNSARLEAAVEALELGYSLDQVPIPSRLCLDLLNEELRAQIESQREEQQ